MAVRSSCPSADLEQGEDILIAVITRDGPSEDEPSSPKTNCFTGRKLKPAAPEIILNLKVKAEVSLLEELKASKMKELVLKKKAELEDVCRKTHLSPGSDSSIDIAIDAVESGFVDTSFVLEQIELQIFKVKEEALSRKEILEKVEKWMAACDEESWLEEYNRRRSSYSETAEKARALANKLPAMVDTLTSKATAWENERGVHFTYDGVRLLSMLKDYIILREEKEQERKRQRDQKKLQGQLQTEHEALYGSKPSPMKNPSAKKGPRLSCGGASNRRLSLDGPMHQTPKPDMLSSSKATPNTRNAKKSERTNPDCLRDDGFVALSNDSGVAFMPVWDAKMTVEELDDNKKRSFLEWHRNLARLEENENLVLTPFEKNLDIWRQLWRVLERSDLIVIIVDARNPLFYRCPDLEAYAREIDEHKRTLLLVDKADLLPYSVREEWVNYFQQNGILFLFWSAKADELLTRLQSKAREIASMGIKSKSSIHSDDESAPAQSVVVGFVGYPNVGKSSTINALVGEKRTAEGRAGGCESGAEVRYRGCVQNLITEAQALRGPNRPPLGDELLRAYCASRGYVASSGLPDETRAARQILKDYINGKLPHFQMPPEISDDEDVDDDDEDVDDDDEDVDDDDDDDDEDDDEDEDVEVSSWEIIELDESGKEDEIGSRLEHMLSDLNAFDIDNGLAPTKVAAVKEKPAHAPHKQHKKTQRKKDRLWRVRGSESDGMPVVRVFQKPVNRGPVDALLDWTRAFW
ncbi:65-kda microtubule-associated protein 3 [Phtheirospermum japonicum]|uniref:65-kDa microtubule-associated protein 3 n=2 Tax=Magnoliopsida TaxID=3398 RepID=A0A830C3R6_9LAMI|nr:65-kda microtubule-associated protein 3 [Phtheirospermum japonicum]